MALKCVCVWAVQSRWRVILGVNPFSVYVTHCRWHRFSKRDGCSPVCSWCTPSLWSQTWVCHKIGLSAVTDVSCHRIGLCCCHKLSVLYCGHRRELSHTEVVVLWSQIWVVTKRSLLCCCHSHHVCTARRWSSLLHSWVSCTLNAQNGICDLRTFVLRTPSSRLLCESTPTSAFGRFWGLTGFYWGR